MPQKHARATSRKRGQEEAVWASDDAWARSLQDSWTKRRVGETTSMDIETEGQPQMPPWRGEGLQWPAEGAKREDEWQQPPVHLTEPKGNPHSFAPWRPQKEEEAEGHTGDESEEGGLPAFDIPLPKFANNLGDAPEVKPVVTSHASNKPYVNESGILVFHEQPAARTISLGFWQQRTRAEIAIQEARFVLRAAGAEKFVEEFLPGPPTLPVVKILMTSKRSATDTIQRVKQLRLSTATSAGVVWANPTMDGKELARVGPARRAVRMLYSERDARDPLPE